jgi:hypothetical protein
MAFCATYETACMYGGAERFADEAACLSYYDDAAAGCQTCITMHVGFVATMGVSHCPHAMGAGPCSGPCM